MSNTVKFATGTTIKVVEGTTVDARDLSGRTGVVNEDQPNSNYIQVTTDKGIRNFPIDAKFEVVS